MDNYTETWGDHVEHDFAEAEMHATTAEKAQRRGMEEASAAEQNLSMKSSRMFNHAESQKQLNSVGKGKDRHIEKIDEPCKFLYCDEHAPKGEWRLNPKGVLCAPLRRALVAGSECWAHEYHHPKTKVLMKPHTCAHMHPNENGWRVEWNTNLFFKHGMDPSLQVVPFTVKPPFQCFNCGSPDHQPRNCDTGICGNEFLGECEWGQECRYATHHGKPLKWLGAPGAGFVKNSCLNCGSTEHTPNDCNTEICGNEFLGECALGKGCKRAAHHGKTLKWLGPPGTAFVKAFVKRPVVSAPALHPFICFNCGASGHHPKDCQAEMCGNEFSGRCKLGLKCSRAEHHGKPLIWLGSSLAFEKAQGRGAPTKLKARPTF